MGWFVGAAVVLGGWQDYLAALVPLLLAVDPLGTLPMYVAAAEQVQPSHRRRLYLRSVGASLVIAVVFIFLGKAIFAFLGITVADFQIAGGLLLLAIALYEIVVPARQPPAQVDPSIVPLAVPLTVGPAAITVSLTLVDSEGPLATFLALTTVLALLLALLFLSERVLRVVSTELLRAFGKIVYLLLAAIGVHYVFRGLATVLSQNTTGGVGG